MHEAGRMAATVRDMCKADKGWRPDPGLGDVVQQDEAVSRAAHDVHRPVRKKEGVEKGPRHGKCHVASLNHGDRSMTGPACGAIINSPCALEAIDAEEVDTELDGALCMSNSGCARCHHVSVCRTHKERGKDGESSLDGAGRRRADLLHLCRTIHPASFSFLMTGPGLLPAVSTMLMPSSMMAWA